MSLAVLCHKLIASRTIVGRCINLSPRLKFRFCINVLAGQLRGDGIADSNAEQPRILGVIDARTRSANQRRNMVLLNDILAGQHHASENQATSNCHQLLI